MRQGFLLGDTTAEIAKKVRGHANRGYEDGALQLSRSNAASIAKTAVGHMAAVARNSFTDANSDILKGKQWLSTLDTHTTPQCRIRDRLKYTLENKPIGHKVPYLQGPGKIHFCCRSTETFILKSAEELGIDVREISNSTRASMDGQVTDLIPDLYEALDVVSRELTGFIPAVNRNSNVERAALGQSVRVPVTNQATAANNTPGVTAPDSGDAVVDNVEVTISKSKHVPVRWNGEETRGLQNAGTFSTIQADRFYQAMRTLVNEIESDLWLEGYKNASRAYGTAGTTPFGTAADMTDFAGVLRILEENGAPRTDLQLVLGHAAIGNLRGKQSGLFKVTGRGVLSKYSLNRIDGVNILHGDLKLTALVNEVTDKPKVDHIITALDLITGVQQRYKVITVVSDAAAATYSIQLRRA